MSTFSITFADLKDFVDSVLHLGIPVVRLESLVHDEVPGKDAPSSWRSYTIVLTTRNEDEILVCRIVVGGIWTIFAKEAAGLVYSDNLVTAERLVRAYLLMRGLDVQPGAYTLNLNHKDLITAGAHNIWQFQEKRLVPCWENFPQYGYDKEVRREIKVVDSAHIYEINGIGNGYALRFDDGIAFGPIPTIEIATQIAHLIHEVRYPTKEAA